MSKFRENRFFGQKLFNFRIIVTFICHFLMSNIFDESFKWENRIQREIWHGMTIKKHYEFYFRWLEDSVIDVLTNLFEFQPSKLETLF